LWAGKPSEAGDWQMCAYWNAAQRQPAKDLGFLQPRCYLARFLVDHDEFDIGSVLTHDKRSEAGSQRLWFALAKLSTRQMMHSELR
jgi:hypothetical protein